MNKKNLAAIILATSIGFTGCANLSPKRANLYEANNFKGTSAQYFANMSDKETLLDAAETDREARCLSKLDEFKYKSLDNAYKNLSSCVTKERYKDMAIYGIGAIVIDGLKLYGLVNGLRGSIRNSSSAGSTPTPTPTPTPRPIGSSIGIPSSGSTTIWSPIQ